VSVNHEAARMFELGPAPLLPQPLDQMPLAAHWRGHLEEAVNHWRAAGQFQQRETQPAATQQLLETSVVPLGADDAGTLRVCVLTADVTSRRLLDLEVAQSRRLRALGELVGGIAHEFNNLLTPVLMTTSHSRSRHHVDPESREGFAVIEQAALRAADLTRRLLTFGRKVDERAQPVRLAEAVDNCFALLRPTVDRRIVWSFRPAPGLPAIPFNPTDLSQIVFNLVINARDTLLEKLAHPPDAAWTPQLNVSVDEIPVAEGPPRLTSALRTPAAWQRLRVEDNGRGIAPDIVERIFEPFFTTKEVGKGTGLGLATVWHLVTEAGGDVSVESTPGEGACFQVLLPRWGARPPDAAGGAAVHPAAAYPPPVRVLLVEDEPLVARAALALLQHAGHLVTHQPDGAEAWAYLSAHAEDCDLLLADINMPQMNGVDLVRHARGIGFRGRILMMSGRVTPEEKRALDELRIDGILGKPFTAEQLRAAVQKVLAGRAPDPAPA
jgi:signal transduction histidine kinase